MIYRRQGTPLFHCRLLGASLALMALPLGAAPQPPAGAPKSGPKAPAAPPAAKDDDLLFQSYVMDTDNSGMAFTVSLNGWTITSSAGVEGYFSSSRVDEYVIDGQNTVVIHVTAPPHPKTPPGGLTVRIRATRGEAFSYDWEPGDPKRPLPFRTEAHFETHLPGGPCAWQNGARLTLDVPTKEAINVAVRRVFDAISTKNAAEAAALFAPRMRDQNLRENAPIAGLEKRLQEGFEEDLARPQSRLLPVDYARLRYTLAADGRVVHVQRADGHFALRDAVPDSDGTRSGYDLFFSLVNGQWVLSR